MLSNILKKHRGWIVSIGLVLISITSVISSLAFIHWQDQQISIRNLTVTNLTESAATITWTSDTQYAGKISYVKSSEHNSGFFPQLNTEVAYDDRDVELSEDGRYELIQTDNKRRYTHHVTLRNLEPETSYTFRVAGRVFGREGVFNRFQTAAIQEDIQTPDPAYGKIIGDVSEDAVVIIRALQSNDDQIRQVSTTLAKSSNTDTANEHTYSFDLAPFQEVYGNIDEARLAAEIRTQSGGTVDHLDQSNERKPLETIVIEEAEVYSVSSNQNSLQRLNKGLSQNVRAESTSETPECLPDGELNTTVNGVLMFKCKTAVAGYVAREAFLSDQYTNSTTSYACSDIKVDNVVSASSDIFIPICGLEQTEVNPNTIVRPPLPDIFTDSSAEEPSATSTCTADCCGTMEAIASSLGTSCRDSASRGGNNVVMFGSQCVAMLGSDIDAIIAEGNYNCGGPDPISVNDYCNNNGFGSDCSDAGQVGPAQAGSTQAESADNDTTADAAAAARRIDANSTCHEFTNSSDSNYKYYYNLLAEAGEFERFYEFVDDFPNIDYRKVSERESCPSWIVRNGLTESNYEIVSVDELRSLEFLDQLSTDLLEDSKNNLDGFTRTEIGIAREMSRILREQSNIANEALFSRLTGSFPGINPEEVHQNLLELGQNNDKLGGLTSYLVNQNNLDMEDAAAIVRFLVAQPLSFPIPPAVVGDVEDCGSGQIYDSETGECVAPTVYNQLIESNIELYTNTSCRITQSDEIANRNFYAYLQGGGYDSIGDSETTITFTNTAQVESEIESFTSVNSEFDLTLCFRPISDPELPAGQRSTFFLFAVCPEGEVVGQISSNISADQLACEDSSAANDMDDSEQAEDTVDLSCLDGQVESKDIEDLCIPQDELNITEDTLHLTPQISAQDTPASPGSVLQASDEAGGEASTLSVNESGRYAFFRDGERVAEQELVVSGDELQFRLYEDLNGNGSLDEGEQYLEDYSSISLTNEASLEQYQLNAGWNLLHLPLVDTREQNPIVTAADLIANWNDQGVNVVHVARYKQGNFEIYSERQGENYAADFDLVPGEGLFVLNLGDSRTVTFSGQAVIDSLPVPLNNGWNLVGFTNTTDQTSVEDIFTTSSEQGISVDTVSQFENGRYQSLVLGEIDGETEIFGNDFNLVITRGYFLRVEAGGGQEFEL